MQSRMKTSKKTITWRNENRKKCKRVEMKTGWNENKKMKI